MLQLVAATMKMAAIVLCVPSDSTTNSWHGLGLQGLGGIGELAIFLYILNALLIFNIFSLGNSHLLCGPILGVPHCTARAQ